MQIELMVEGKKGTYQRDGRELIDGRELVDPSGFGEWWDHDRCRDVSKEELQAIKGLTEGENIGEGV